MFGFVWNLLMCATAGIFLSVVFLSPAGAIVGAANGVLVGICVGLGTLRLRHEES
jgi:hypothetical protein